MSERRSFRFVCHHRVGKGSGHNRREIEIQHRYDSRQYLACHLCADVSLRRRAYRVTARPQPERRSRPDRADPHDLNRERNRHGRGHQPELAHFFPDARLPFPGGPSERVTRLSRSHHPTRGFVRTHHLREVCHAIDPHVRSRAHSPTHPHVRKGIVTLLDQHLREQLYSGRPNAVRGTHGRVDGHLQQAERRLRLEVVVRLHRAANQSVALRGNR